MPGTDQATLTIEQGTFEKTVLEANRPVLVDFWAEWCGPCRALGPVIDELAEAYAGRVDIGKANVDTNGDLAARYRVSAIPTLILFKDGTEVERIIGLRGKAELSQLLNTALGGANP